MEQINSKPEYLRTLTVTGSPIPGAIATSLISFQQFFGVGVYVKRFKIKSISWSTAITTANMPKLIGVFVPLAEAPIFVIPASQSGFTACDIQFPVVGPLTETHTITLRSLTSDNFAATVALPFCVSFTLEFTA